MTIASLHLMRRLLLQVVAIIEGELRLRGVRCDARERAVDNHERAR